MDRCSMFFDQMADLREGALDDADQQRLFTHLASCPSCRELFDFQADLTAAEIDEPSSEEFGEVRQAVLDEIRRQPSRTASVIHFPFPQGGQARQILAVAAVVVLMITAFISGLLFSRGPAFGPDSLLAALEENARTHSRFQEVEDSQTLVSNFAVRSLDGSRVQMAFDVTRHLEIERPKNDPLVNELLVHAMLDQSSMGARLKAVSLADSSANGKVQEALIFAMLNDSELPVRLRALETLASWPVDENVEHALTTVLRADESIQMRLLAIELLTQGGLEKSQILEDLLHGEEGLDPAVAENLLRVSNS